MNNIISDLIQSANFEEAAVYMEQWKQDAEVYTDTMAVFDATICENMGNREGCFEAIRKGLFYNALNYELYYMLGYYYFPVNINQAYLCFQNALLYCMNPEDYAVVEADVRHLEQSGQVTVKGTTILIASYNAMYFQQKNIESIRLTTRPEDRHILVVDNGSTDGILQWMREQTDITLVENGENLGFSKACNIGVSRMKELGWEEDVFLLNNDTRLAPNTLFWLKMGLYENEKIGATGGISNYAGNNQQLNVIFPMPDDYLVFGRKNNVPDKAYLEERVRLSGFALLVKHGLWEMVNGMDEVFTPGYFEDDDLSMKLAKQGYRMMLCRNAFLYHAGSQSFAKRNDIEDLLMDHYRLFIEKYGFPILDYAYAEEAYEKQIPFGRTAEFNCLEVGSGLGANLKRLKRCYPNAHFVGVEKNEEMYQIVKNTEVVFTDLNQADRFFANDTFQVLLISQEEQVKLNEAERSILNRICRNDCIVLPQQQVEEKLGLDFSKIKLVIWDMDQTFWKGILSEGMVEPIPEYMALVRKMTDCGVVNSISSKNNKAEVLKELQALDMAEYFVFSDINWESKGPQIQKKLQDMHLRAENVLFVDDDPKNLEEAEFYNAGIMTGLPSILGQLVQYFANREATDCEHKRLQQYKVLEQKRSAEKVFSSKLDFLRFSEIKVAIGLDCVNQLERIAELVSRSNQLNYTKRRESREELEHYVSSPEYKTGYVCAQDRFGEYGLVGFFCLDSMGEVKHFLFSCRIVGMGIVQWVYEKLGRPCIDIVEPVAEELCYEKPVDWVQELPQTATTQKNSQSNQVKILLKGPCDMSAIESYLIGGALTCEFTFVNSQGFITSGHNHSMNIWESANCSKQSLEQLIHEVPFITKDDFETSIFAQQYHVICFSLLTDCHAGLYKKKQENLYINFGSRNFDLTNPDNWNGYMDGTIVNHAFPFTEQILKEFAKNWEFVEATSEEMLLRNMEYIYNHVKGNPKFILILGSELEYEGENEEFAKHAVIHERMNRVAREFAQNHERVFLVEVSKLIHSQEDYIDCIDHFSRRIYYELATEVVKYINQ